MDSQQSFYHTSFVCNDRFGATDRYRLFREKILPQLMKLRPQLEKLYCENNGRPAIDPVLLCGVTLLQFMEKVSDRRAAEQMAYHLGWKSALELELAYQGFHPTVLVYFRDRLEENQASRVIFDGVIDLLIDQGLIKRGGKQRIDSTHILGYVKEMSRLECATETMRLAMEELAGIGVKKPAMLGQNVGSVCAEQSGLAVKQIRAPEPVSAMRARYQRAVGMDGPKPR